MNLQYKYDYINYRIVKAFETLEDAKLLAENKRWNSSVNRLYYSCFYAVVSILIKNKIEPKTHDGVRTQFGLHFVKTGIIDKKYGKLYTKLFDYRLKGDYGDFFNYDKELVEPLFEQVEEFLGKIKELVDKI